MVPPLASNASPRTPDLLDQLRDKLRLQHYALRTEKAYLNWIRRYILFHGRRHPREMGVAEVEAFLTDLAVGQNVSASTQNQALAALLFLYKFLQQPLPNIQAIRARRAQRLPTVPSPDEVRRIIPRISDSTLKLVVQLLYGTGMRLIEACRLRIKDLDFDRNQIIVREAKGDKDRVVPLPATLAGTLRQQRE